MSEVTDDQLAALEQYIRGSQPDDRGELEIYCPMHPDTKRSASVNVNKGVWYCHAGCGGGSVRHLLLAEDAWVPVEGRGAVLAPAPAGVSSSSVKRPTKKEVEHWHRRLRRDKDAMGWLVEHRGLTLQTIRKALVGYDGRHYKIPVLSPRRRLWNVRTYNPDPKGGTSKIWNTRGMGDARIYPVGVVKRMAEPGSAVMFCEGEWDALLVLQYGYLAVTRTDGAGKPWHDRWTDYFTGLRVFMCHDRDDMGKQGDNEVADSLTEVASVYQCDLPMPASSKGGKDLTDYLLAHPEHSRADALGDLFTDATPWRST